MRIAAVCDCFARAATNSSKPLKNRFDREHPRWATYDDFPPHADKEKLDGVMLETTTHARAWLTINCMQAGKDTYIEKPMCLTIAEGR